MIRPLVWTLASISAAGPHPSASRALWRVSVPARTVSLQCAGECPSNTDRLELLAKLLMGIRASSTSIGQLAIGTSGLA